jgi:hypothetical protein
MLNKVMAATFAALVLAILLADSSLSRAHDAVVVDVQKTDAALLYACTGFVTQLINEGKILPSAKEVKVTLCVNTIAKQFGAELYQHDHS